MQPAEVIPIKKAKIEKEISAREEIVNAIHNEQKHIEKIILSEGFYLRLGKEVMPHAKLRREDKIYEIPSYVRDIKEDYQFVYKTEARK